MSLKLQEHHSKINARMQTTKTFNQFTSCACVSIMSLKLQEYHSHHSLINIPTPTPRTYRYDAIIMMIETLGQDGIRNENHITSIVRPMVSKLQTVKNDNRMILPLLECFTSLCKEFGLSAPMQSLARPLYHRALKIVEFGLLAGTAAAEKGEDDFLESEHIYVALDLVSGLADGIENNMQVIVQNTNLLDLLGHCANVKNFYVCIRG